MNRVFISHASRDLEWAMAVCRLLEERGAVCFLDQRDLDRTKPSWPVELVKAIEGSAHLVLLLSRASSASEEVLNEVANASAHGKDIIPVLRENIAVRDELMYFIRKYEWINLFDYSDEDGARLLLERILGPSARSRREPAVKVAENELTKYECACFEGIDSGGFGAGWDKCLMQNGPAGWKPEDIVIEEVDDTEFRFADTDMPELDEAYEAYCRTPEIIRMRRRGNDRTRWMVAGIYQNNRIYLSLRKTRYSMTSFWWDRVRGSAQMQRSMAERVFGQDEVFFPNSFCLHLILETQDGMLVCTRISNNKKNDYGRSIAVTIGEQLSEIDFGSCRSYNDSFVNQWVKRSMIEEFSLHNDDYEKYVDVSSIRVLALSYEGDICNFALPVFVRLKMDCRGFMTYLGASGRSNDEFTEILPKTPREALEIVKSWEDETARNAYHPSSFLRALLYLAYKGVKEEAEPDGA